MDKTRRAVGNKVVPVENMAAVTQGSDWLFVPFDEWREVVHHEPSNGV